MKIEYAPRTYADVSFETKNWIRIGSTFVPNASVHEARESSIAIVGWPCANPVLLVEDSLRADLFKVLSRGNHSYKALACGAATCF